MDTKCSTWYMVLSLGAATDRIAFRASFLVCKIPLGFTLKFAPYFLPALAKTAPTYHLNGTYRRYVGRMVVCILRIGRAAASAGRSLPAAYTSSWLSRADDGAVP